MNVKSPVNIPLNQKGFTLLEIIVAIGVFAVLTALAYGGLNQVLNQSRATTEVSDELQNLQYVFAFIQQDFSQIVSREVRDEYGNRQPALQTPIDESALIRLTRSGWTNPAEQPRSSFQRVAYVLEDTALQRQFWFDLDRTNTSEPVEMTMLDNVEEINFRFLNADNEWQESWPPAVGTSTSPLLLPLAIEVNILTLRWGKLKRLFSLVNLPADLPTTTAPGPGNTPSPGTDTTNPDDTNNPDNTNPDVIENLEERPS